MSDVVVFCLSFRLSLYCPMVLWCFVLFFVFSRVLIFSDVFFFLFFFMLLSLPFVALSGDIIRTLAAEQSPTPPQIAMNDVCFFLFFFFLLNFMKTSHEMLSSIIFPSVFYLPVVINTLDIGI